MNDQRSSTTHPEMQWSGWGDPAEAVTLSESTRALLQTALRVQHPVRTVSGPDAVVLPPSRLDDGAADALAGIVGAEHVLTDDCARLRHLRGKSTPDLLKIRAGNGADAPDAIVLPASRDEVLDLLRLCSERLIAVVPFGGGTSVVGGLAVADSSAFSAVVSLDVSRMNRLIALDEVSRTATLEPGLRGPDAEALLAERGYTIGHHPQSFMFASIGGFAAARSSGQASAGYGRFDENVVALTVATPRGAIELGRAPKSAAGPDLRQLFLGSEGALGVITSVTVQVRPAPEAKVYDGWRFASFAAGTDVVRRLIQDGPVPTVLRLSDEAETALNLARPIELSNGGAGTGAAAPEAGCLAILGYEGTAADVDARRDRVSAIVRDAGATADPGAGEAWARGRYHGPYLRDALLGEGALVETLETAAFWSAIPDLYRAVGETIAAELTEQGTPPIVLCHVSHVYASGASLYFTIACAATEDPVSQWMRAKAAASDAILNAGGSITHHHGIGRDHRPWYERQIGSLAVEALQAVKATVDPAGILNPGALIP